MSSPPSVETPPAPPPPADVRAIAAPPLEYETKEQVADILKRHVNTGNIEVSQEARLRGLEAQENRLNPTKSPWWKTASPEKALKTLKLFAFLIGSALRELAESRGREARFRLDLVNLFMSPDHAPYLILPIMVAIMFGLLVLYTRVAHANVLKIGERHTKTDKMGPSMELARMFGTEVGRSLREGKTT